MPYKFQLINWKLPRRYDRRVKFTAEDKKLVKFLYQKNGKVRQTVREFYRLTKRKISRRYVQLIFFPERLQHARELQKQLRKNGRYYPGAKKWAKIMRNHRHYKHKIFKKINKHNKHNKPNKEEIATVH